MTVEVKFVRTHPQAKLPTKSTEGAVGFDLYIVSEVWLAPGERALVNTGWNIAVPDGFEAQIRPRSGLALKQGITVLNTPATIDPDFRGSLGVILLNTDGEKSFRAIPGDRIAQLVIAPVTSAIMVEVEAFTDSTVRGEKGYGSTGI